MRGLLFLLSLLLLSPLYGSPPSKPLNFLLLVGAGLVGWRFGKGNPLKLLGFALALTLSFSFRFLVPLRPALATAGFALMAWSENKGEGALPLAGYAVGVYLLRLIKSIFAGACSGLLDFWGFWLGTQAVAAGRPEKLFLPVKMASGVIHYLGVTGHPFSLLMWAPLGTLDILKASSVMQLLSLSLTGALIFLLIRRARKPWERVMALWLIMSPNLKATMCNASNLSMVAAPLLGLALQAGLPKLEGILMALSSTFKLSAAFPLLLLPLSGSKARWLAGWLAVALFTALCFFAFGPTVMIRWLKLMASLSVGQWTNPISYHPAWFLAKLGVSHALLIGYTASLLVASSLVLLSFRLPWPERGAAWTLAIPYLQNFIWAHHFLIPLFGSWSLVRRNPLLLPFLFFPWTLLSYKGHLPARALLFLGTVLFLGASLLSVVKISRTKPNGPY